MVAASDTAADTAAGTRSLTVAVTGSTGNVGSDVVRRLAGTPGIQVVALARRPQAVAEHVPDGVPARRFDYDDAASLPAALERVDVVVFVSGDGEADIMLRQHLDVVAAIRDAGVPRAVYLSSAGADRRSPFCYDRVNAVTEDALAAAVPRVHVVRAGLYEEFLHALMGDGPEVRLPAASGRVAPVRRTDVAAALAEAVSGPLPEGVRRVVGVRDLTLGEIARDRGQRFVTVSPGEYRARLVADGESAWWSFAYASMLVAVEQGRYAAEEPAATSLSPTATMPGATTSA